MKAENPEFVSVTVDPKRMCRVRGKDKSFQMWKSLWTGAWPDHWNTDICPSGLESKSKPSAHRNAKEISSHLNAKKHQISTNQVTPEKRSQAKESILFQQWMRHPDLHERMYRSKCGTDIVGKGCIWLKGKNAQKGSGGHKLFYWSKKRTERDSIEAGRALPITNRLAGDTGPFERDIPRQVLEEEHTKKSFQWYRHHRRKQ